MDELQLISRQEPGLVSIDNFAEMKEALSAVLARYENVVYSEESLAEAKADKKELTRLRKDIDDRRKEIKRAYLAPYNDFEAQVKDRKYGLVGEIVQVNPKVVEDVLDNGYIPVISTVAQGRDAVTAYNINADTAAAKLAIALKAEKLILLTDVRGLLRDPKDENTLIHVVHMSDVPMLKKSGVIQGGMIPKVECCVEAVRSGVKRSHILDGRIPHSILIEMLSDRGIGTMLEKED